MIKFSKMEGSKNNLILNPFLMDFGSLWGSTLRPFCPPKINEKPSLLQGPLQGRPMDTKSLQNDAKWSPMASNMEPKMKRNGSQPTRVTRIKKPTKFEYKSGFRLGLTECVQKHGRASFPLGARRDSRSAGSITGK